MSSYSELIKNFDKIRAYMRDFYLYGFKSRDEFDKKSLRSYDNERRRVESWLGEHTRFHHTPDGKTMFLSIDSRACRHNPLYKAWKASSFTDLDITLHFILFDILCEPSVSLTLPELVERIDSEYLAGFEDPMVFDESTVRKKLKEYTHVGVILAEKKGRSVYYRRAESLPIQGLEDALDYFSEVAPCGVIGSFLLDKCKNTADLFRFKHHYITSAIDSEILALLFTAMQDKKEVLLTSAKGGRERSFLAVPLRVFISVQNGRQYLLAYDRERHSTLTLRLDYLLKVKIGETAGDFDHLRHRLSAMEEKMWGVNVKYKRDGREHLERLSFTLAVSPEERHVIRQLEREKRCGTVERLDATTYRFSARVYDAGEMIPWIRTFLGYITDLSCSNRALERQFKDDLLTTYALYGIKEDSDDLQ